MGITVGIGAGASVGTVLGLNHLIMQVDATVRAGTGVGTILGVNDNNTSNDVIVSSTQGANDSTEELVLTMPIIANLDTISLRHSNHNKPSRKLQE